MDAVAQDRASRLARVSSPPVERICLVMAFLIPMAWFLLYHGFGPDHLVDEGGHLGNIHHFLEGKPGWPQHMTMLPGYHFMVAALWQLGPPITLLALARLVSTLTALLGLAAFAFAWTRIHGRHPGRATLLFALFPILQPFTGMAYTDAPGIAFVLLALGAHLAGHRLFAAVLFTAATGLRQTNLLWVAFVVAIEWASPLAFAPHPAAPIGSELRRPDREFFRRTGGLLLLLGCAAVVLGAAGRVAVGTQTGTELRPNIANLHCAALLVLLLGLPIWLRLLPGAFRRGRDMLRTRPARTLAFAALAGAAAVSLALTFANPHPWNRDLFWEGTTFTLLRNWPLVWIEQHPALRFLSGLNIVSLTIALAILITRQPHRVALWLALAVGALLPAANNLVEPRYFIPAAGVMLVWLDFGSPFWRTLALWWAALCVVHAPFIVRGLSLW